MRLRARVKKAGHMTHNAINHLMREATFKIKTNNTVIVKLTPLFRFRIWLAVELFKLAARIIGYGHIEVNGIEDGKHDA
jgi:phenylalanyl-tRNA synthetase beta subunit